MLERNVGDIDRSLRFIAGIALMLIGIMWNQLLFFIPSFILIATSLVGVCPLYSLLRINSKTQIDHPYLVPDAPEVPEIPDKPQEPQPEQTEEEEPLVRRRVKKNGKKK